MRRDAKNHLNVDTTIGDISGTASLLATVLPAHISMVIVSKTAGRSNRYFWNRLGNKLVAFKEDYLLSFIL